MISKTKTEMVLPPAAVALMRKVSNHTASVGVVGLGYVGLPFLLEKAKVGFHVTGIDRNEDRVRMTASGVSYISDVPKADLSDLVERGFVHATTSFDAVSELDVIVICVPTPLTKNLSPDLSFVEAVTKEIASRVREGQLISLESTTYPGTTDEVLRPLLEQSGLRVGREIFLAHSPERVDPGNVRYSTKNTNKIVGASDVASRTVAEHFYQQTISTVVTVSSAKAAELAKVYENTFRAVNIALANELALLCDRMDLDVWEVLGAVFTKPFGIMPFWPGPGVGGHCIPIDPHYLEWKAKEFDFETHFIALAGETNRKMPEFVVRKAARQLNGQYKSLKGAKILLLGVAYKSDIDDWRESPAIKILDKLEDQGAIVEYHDSFVPAFSHNDRDRRSVDLTDELLGGTDLVIITTKHSGVDYDRVLKGAALVFDTRNALANVSAGNLVRL